MTAMPGELRLDRAALVVGVVGDDLPLSAHDEAALRGLLDLRIADFSARFPSTPLVLLSALATRPEMIAAELAAARGILVAACLVGTADACEARLPESERARFRAALATCTRVDPIADAGQLALYIAYQSHLVIACSAATQAGDRTGTLIDVRMNGVFPKMDDYVDVPYLPDVGPVFQIVFPEPGAALQALVERRRFPVRFHHDKQSERDFWATLERLDRYNADIRDVRRAGGFTPGVEGLRERTSATANDLQQKTLAALIGLYIAALVAAAMQVFAGTRGELLKLGTLAIAFAFYWFTRRRDVENRYQDYRALSEGLRVQGVWSRLGLPVLEVERSYLRMQQSELQWIRLALRYASMAETTPAQAARPNDPAAWKPWIRLQWRYYYRAARREEAKLRYFGIAVKAVFAVAGIATLIGAAVLFLPKAGFVAHVAPIEHLLAWAHRGLPTTFFSALTTAPLAMASAVAILAAHYSEKRGFEANVKRYERMFIVFDRARRQLHLIDTGRAPGEVVQIVRQLGEAALIEHADWLLTRRERPWSFVGT
jgi:hypothetical protein